MNAVNHQFRLAARPLGLPRPSDWQYTEEPVPEPGDGEVLVKIRYIGLEPAMRGWMNESRSYIPPVGIGDVMRGFAAGEVIASNHPDIAVGDHVSGLLGVQEYAVANGDGVFKLDTGLAPLETYLGTLGMPGMTAYFGLIDIGRPTEGETVVVSGAGRRRRRSRRADRQAEGLPRRGDRGRRREVPLRVEELGFDAAIDYKSDDVMQALGEQCPKGIDVYFDNVGGEILDAALAHLARHARVVICGAISQYNVNGAMRGPANYMSLLVNHASMTGFVFSDYLDRSRRPPRRWAVGSPPGSCPRARTSPRAASRSSPTPCCGCSAVRTRASSC